MSIKYLAKIIAKDRQGLQMISACCAGAQVKIANIKYLQKNKVFLMSLTRSKIETKNVEKKINSFFRCEFVDNVKSKNIKQSDPERKVELVTIDYLKNNNNYEINLIFTNKAYITLSTEIIEVILDDQNKIT